METEAWRGRMWPVVTYWWQAQEGAENSLCYPLSKLTSSYKSEVGQCLGGEAPFCGNLEAWVDFRIHEGQKSAPLWDRNSNSSHGQVGIEPFTDSISR